jgi:hypothetical protein
MGCCVNFLCPLIDVGPQPRVKQSLAPTTIPNPVTLVSHSLQAVVAPMP